MPDLEMQGPYEFSTTEIDKVVSTTSPGNYAFGFIRSDGFVPTYVGRSDTDLNKELKSYLTTRKHPNFMFSYANSVSAAYRKECKNYHDFQKQLENENHPARPKGASAGCHLCGK